MNLQLVTTGDIFPPHSWYHVAVALERVQLDHRYEYVGSLYVNGFEQASFNLTNPSVLVDWQVNDEGPMEFSMGGGRYDHGDLGKQFVGLVDEARVWDMVRDQDDVQMLMCQPARGSQSRMVGIWHFDEPSETAVLWSDVCDEWGLASVIDLNDSLDGNSSSVPFPGCKSYDATPNANDLVLIRHPDIIPAGLPFHASGAMQPEIEARDTVTPIYLDAGGTASVFAEQLVAENVVPYCFEGMSVEPGSFYCQDTGEQFVELSATGLYGNTSSANAAVEVIDAIAPEIDSSVPETITPPEMPISFAAIATDNCGISSFEVTDFNCYKYNQNGKQISKTKGCKVELSGDRITLSGSAGVDTLISWSLMAVDGNGNRTEETYETLVVNPGRKIGHG
jgi:hypothetical protein